jgi:hypothetical protein
VDREEAAQALAVLRNVVSQARDDTALQNWGVIWIVHGVLNGGGFIGTHFLLAAGYTDPPPFVAMWGVLIALDLVATFVLKKRRAGVRTFVETQLWTIWTTFIGAVSLLAILNHLMGLATFFLGPVIGVLGAVGFASMGSLMGRHWYAGTAALVVTALLMAAFHQVQFLILGGAWMVAQVVGGVLLDRERRRQLQGGASARLV